MLPYFRPYLLLVLEMMEGGELFDRISKQKRFTERKAARYFKKVRSMWVNKSFLYLFDPYKYIHSLVNVHLFK